MERAAEKLHRLVALSQKRSGRKTERVSVDAAKSSVTSFKYASWSDTLVGMNTESTDASLLRDSVTIVVATAYTGSTG